MRADALGLFWEDIPVKAARGANAVRVVPPTPETGWRPPTFLPDLSTAHTISIDLETKDPELTDYTDEDGNAQKGKGPGWARHVGHIIGIAVGADGGGRWYFPIRHELEPELNWDAEVVLAWAREQFGRPHQPKVGANILYDVGWLKEEGVEVKGQLYDVQYAEALLDESAQVNLEALGQKYLNTGKETNVIYEWLSRAYGGPANGGQRRNFYRCSPRLVGPYAEVDADLPMRVLVQQWPLLAREGLLDLYHMECRLIPLLVAMRFAGVRVSVPKAELLREELLARAKVEQEKLDWHAGGHVDINSAQSLACAFDKLGIRYGKTPKGAPSFTKEFLEQLDHPVGVVIREIRKLEKLAGTFVQSYILNAHRDGMVYGQFHALRGGNAGKGGTRSGRFSGSSPNLQNLPSRDEELAPLVRALFEPDIGHKQWQRYDYSQIEYRFLIHYAVGPGSDEVRQLFNAHPETDYHDMTLDMVAPVAGWEVKTKEQRKHRRKPLKNINFGLIYGMGTDKLSRSLGLSVKEGKNLFSVYHKAVPFAKPTMEWCIEEAQITGVVRTILNRASRFDLWEPAGWGNEGRAMPYELALRTYGNIERANTHKALNRKLQGSAADLMKKAMLRCWEEGVFDYIGVPRLTVHDELDFSDPGGRDDGFAYMQHVMETAIPLRIPVRADREVGPDWGHCA